MGQDVRWLACEKLEGPPGQEVEKWKIKKIKLEVDGNPHPEAMGCAVGHVGTLQQGTACRLRTTTTNLTFTSEQPNHGAICRGGTAVTTRCIEVPENTKRAPGFQAAMGRVHDHSAAMSNKYKGQLSATPFSTYLICSWKCCHHHHLEVAQLHAGSKL